MKKSKEELLSFVHPTVTSLCKASSDRWTTENLGGSWPNVRWQEMYNESGGEADDEEWEDGLIEENKVWVKAAAKHSKELLKLKLSLTMENMELAFSNKLKKAV